MNNITLKLRNAISLMVLPLLVLAAACDQATIPSGADDALMNGNLHVTSPFDLQNAGVNGNVAAQLAQVRRHTAHYHDVSIAEAAGYVNVNVGECVADQDLGGMGYHFVNFGLVGSQDDLDITQPQAVLYEPQKNGKLRLVAVEYITELGQPNIDPPTLFGEEFYWNGNLGFWALHVWLWRNNPNGIFEDWNPKVSCDYAW